MGGQKEVWITWNEILRKTDSSEANYVPALERKYNFFHYGRFDFEIDLVLFQGHFILFNENYFYFKKLTCYKKPDFMRV